MFTSTLFAQDVNVDVNVNVNHLLGDDSTFKREKFINIHSDVTTNYWYDNDLFTDNLIDEFLNGYDVYMGRNTGTITWTANSIKEDKNRPGFCDTLDMVRLGQSQKAKYASNTNWHAYEGRNYLNLCTQLWPLYPDKHEATNNNWYYSDTDTDEEPWGTASGEFYAHFIKNFFGEGGATGQPKPAFIEITNEPLWELYEDIDRAFKYHKTMAKEVRKLHPDMPISGYCTAFPNLEEDNFQRWENRWMKFMDVAGEEMDIWSIHLYDAPSIDGGARKKLRRGSYMEGTMDMMEHYSTIKFGDPKSFIISEFGASSHDYKGPWHPYMDYLQNVSCNAMTMQFMERSNTITQAMNYTMLKASWGTKAVDDVWSARLLRRENEPESLTGTWVYSDRVQYYQLWANVKGKRIDTKAHHLDIMTDGFVDGKKAYIVLNNLAEEGKEIKLNLFKNSGLEIENLMVKYFHLDDTKPVYDENVGKIDTLYYSSAEIPESFHIDFQGTMILEYTFAEDVQLNKTNTESKYYATDYYKAIQANKAIEFQIKDIQVPENGEAVLRLGLSREHGKTLRPKVLVNGTEVIVPADFRGDDQKDRDVYFGVVEIDVPVEEIQENNNISITFPESGGHVSSLAMQVYAFDGEVERTGKGEVTGISVTPSTQWLALGGSVQLAEEVYPSMAENKNVSWQSSNTQLATVSNTGMVQAKNTEGAVTITATTDEGNFTASCLITIEEIQPGSLAVDDKNKYKNTTYNTNETIEVIVDYFAGTNETVTKYNGGVHVLLRHIDANWKVIEDYMFSDSTTIGTNKGTAKVQVELNGITPTAALKNGEFWFLFPKFSSTNGDSYSVNGISNINIEKGTTKARDFLKSDIKIYPNPAINKLNIENIEDDTNEISIYSLTGSLLKRTNVSGVKSSIDINEISPGSYILNIKGEMMDFHQLFQINR